MRIASFNVENLFARPKAMDTHLADAERRRAVLRAHARVSELFELADYAPVAEEMLELLATLDLLEDDQGDFALLRKLRGQLLRRPSHGPVELVADGRADWVGWVELTTTAVTERATENTARVIHELDAEVMTVVEADNRPDLDLFIRSLLPSVGGIAYEQVMVVEGNDSRGIDVGLLARASHRLVEIRTHIFDRDEAGPVFSRDCCEYHLETPLGTRFVVLANHLKSKGYSSPGDPIGAKRRLRQATRVAAIYRALRAEGIEHVAVTGDFNDDPSSTALAPVFATDLRDVSEYADFDWNHRRGTYGSGNEKDKIDYVLLSPALFTRVVGGGVFRKGVWHGNRTQDPWDLFPTLTREQDQASDHAAIYADLTDF